MQMMSRFPSLLVQRPACLAAIALWVALAVGLGALQPRLADVATSDQADFLPAGAQSTQAAEEIERHFDDRSERPTALVVYRRAGALTDADRARIAQDRAKVARLGLRPVLLSEPAPLDARQRAALDRRRATDQTGAWALTAPAAPLAAPDVEIMAVTFDTGDEPQQVLTQTAALRRAVRSSADPQAGLTVAVTGQAGLSADLVEVFDGLDAKLLIATVTLVLALLLAVYRAPLVALAPIVVVGCAYAVTAGAAYLLARAGLTVSDQSMSILLVLMFGAGTDYCLLLVARYREELRLHARAADAMARALRRAGGAVLASGGTVIAALLMLSLADLRSTATLGPVGALGIATVMVASLTLLPALLVAGGRRLFWPRGADVAHAGAPAAASGRWLAVGRRAAGRPVLTLIACLAVLGAGASGLVRFDAQSDLTESFRAPTESVRGLEAMRSALPAGTLAPTQVLLSAERKITEAQLLAVAAELARAAELDRLPSGVRVSADGTAALTQITPDADPFGADGERVVTRLRATAGDVERRHRVQVLVGGQSAVALDVADAARRDLTVIVPLVLAAIAIILAALLRAVVAPLYLLAATVISFLGSLGAALLVFGALGWDGFDPTLLTYSFLFLTALGVDYSIFLMHRAREEAARHGTQDGVLIALAQTGTVITSAGLVLAGTFAVLFTLPVVFLAQLGFAVALGVLVDTFIVRTLMVPAMVRLIGDRSWWPGRLPSSPPATPPTAAPPLPAGSGAPSARPQLPPGPAGRFSALQRGERDIPRLHEDKDGGDE